MTDQYRQIGNAVPVGLGEAVGRAILKHMNGRIEEPPIGFPFSRYKNTADVVWEETTLKAMKFDKNNTKSQAIIQKRSRKKLEKDDVIQRLLFPDSL